MAVAQEQEMLAKVQEMRAKVVEAEAQVPLSIAKAFEEGHLGGYGLLQNEEYSIGYGDEKRHFSKRKNKQSTD